MDGGNPRNWKWMTPACAIGAVLMAQMWANAEGTPWMQAYCIFGSGPLLIILFAQSLAGFWSYYSQLFTEQFLERRRAMTTTSETKLFEMARTMHPETVKLLLMHRKTKWRIKEAKVNELVDWVLDADPRVRYEMVEYILVNSNQYAMMPMGRLSDKSFEFDPDRLVNDYDQYRAFHRLLINRGMATEALGNQAGQWIEPWTPELVARQFGIGLSEDDGAGSETRAQQAPLSASQTSPQTDPSLTLRTSLGGKVQAKEPELTDADMARIRALEDEHQKKYTMSVSEFMALKNKKGEMRS